MLFVLQFIFLNKCVKKTRVPILSRVIAVLICSETTNLLCIVGAQIVLRPLIRWLLDFSQALACLLRQVAFSGDIPIERLPLVRRVDEWFRWSDLIRVGSVTIPSRVPCTAHQIVPSGEILYFRIRGES